MAAYAALWIDKDWNVFSMHSINSAPALRSFKGSRLEQETDEVYVLSERLWMQNINCCRFLVNRI